MSLETEKAMSDLKQESPKTVKVEVRHCTNPKALIEVQQSFSGVGQLDLGRATDKKGVAILGPVVAGQPTVVLMVAVPTNLDNDSA